MIKSLFSLTLRQAMGMAKSLLKLAGPGREVPDFNPVSAAPEVSGGDDLGTFNEERITLASGQH